MTLIQKLEYFSTWISKYDLEKGFVWTIRGKLVKYSNKYGYTKIVATINGNPTTCKVHQLIWFLANNEAVQGLDHIDRDKSNNSINNLRKGLTKRQNRLNSAYCDNSKGYSFHTGNSRFYVSIVVNKKNIYGGSYKNEEDAIKNAARLKELYKNVI